MDYSKQKTEDSGAAGSLFATRMEKLKVTVLGLYLSVPVPHVLAGGASTFQLNVLLELGPSGGRPVGRGCLSLPAPPLLSASCPHVPCMGQLSPHRRPCPGADHGVS